MEKDDQETKTVHSSQNTLGYYKTLDLTLNEMRRLSGDTEKRRGKIILGCCSGNMNQA